MKQLKVRLKDVFTDDHFILEAMGRKGVGSPSETKIVIDQNAFARHKLRDAVERRVSQVYTGDHHIVCNGKIQIGDDDDAHSFIQESLTGDSGNVDSSHGSESQDEEDGGHEEEKKSEPRQSHKSKELRGRLSDSFFAFEAMMRARQQASMDGDDWTECSMSVAEPTIRNQAGMLPTISSAVAGGEVDDDDQSCYSEYTVDTTAYQTGHRESIVSLATAVDGSAFVSGPGMDDSRKTVKVNNSQADDLSSKLKGVSIESGEDDGEAFFLMSSA